MKIIGIFLVTCKGVEPQLWKRGTEEIVGFSFMISN